MSNKKIENISNNTLVIEAIQASGVSSPDVRLFPKHYAIVSESVASHLLRLYPSDIRIVADFELSEALAKENEALKKQINSATLDQADDSSRKELNAKLKELGFVYNKDYNAKTPIAELEQLLNSVSI